MSVASALLSRLAPTEAISRRDALALAIISSLHLAALAVMTATELDFATKATFLLVWASLNFFWLALLRRPTIAALLSLTMVVGLILLSQFKYDKLMMTVNFVDLMIIDPDTSAFLFTIMPSLRGPILVGALVAIPLLMVLWRIDPFRVRLRTSAVSGTLCMSGVIAFSIAYPTDLYGEFFNRDYVSKFARSGVEAVYEFAVHGLLESDAVVAERLKAPAAMCSPGGKLPHIILVHDESSFDITAAPGMKVPPGYRKHFQSFDGV
ncbi:MAG TPA: LTA synthase family protein, partial [Pseudolabrys sp.]|nr:LTA synthase family protein [Pseudolabrys sp.]